MKMMNEYQMKLEEGNKVTLPESLVNKLLLRKGETVCLIQEDGIKDKCFKVTAENEKELFDEDFYCIPKRVFDMCHLDYESIQIIVEQGQMVITNPQYVLSYLGKDMITCLLKQNVDSTMLCFLLLISYLLSFSLLNLQWHILITENKDSLIGQHQQYCLHV